MVRGCSSGCSCLVDVRVSHLFTFTFANRGIQRESGVYAWIVVTT